MSILQEYEENEKILGMGRIKAIEDYINYCKNNGVDILYSDIVYKQNEYEMFDKWFKNEIEPFHIVNHMDKCYSLILNYVDFDKNNFSNKFYVNGYDYEDLIKSYVSNKLNHLESELNFDSENGMFAVSSKDIKVIEELAYCFNKDSKDKDYMKSLLQDKELGYE